MSDHSKLKLRATQLIESIGTLSRPRHERAFQEECTPQAILALIAENESLRQALQVITAQVDGNIRPTLRDGVSGQGHVQDIYRYCDQIEAIAAEAMKEPQP